MTDYIRARELAVEVTEPYMLTIREWGQSGRTAPEHLPCTITGAPPLHRPKKYLAYDTPSTMMFLFKKILTFAGYFVLQDLLGSLGSLEFPTGKASVDEVSKCSGDVSIFLIKSFNSIIRSSICA